MAVATGTVPYPLLETLQVRYRIFSRKLLEYDTVSLDLYTTEYRYGTVSLMSSKQQYRTVSRFQSVIGTVPWLQVAWWTWLARAVRQTQRGTVARLSLFSKAAGGHSAISLSHLSQPTRQTRRAALITQVSSPSLHELMSTNIRSFHVHFSIGTLSAVVHLKYSLSASELADLVD